MNGNLIFFMVGLVVGWDPVTQVGAVLLFCTCLQSLLRCSFQYIGAHWIKSRSILEFFLVRRKDSLKIKLQISNYPRLKHKLFIVSHVIQLTILILLYPTRANLQLERNTNHNRTVNLRMTIFVMLVRDETNESFKSRINVIFFKILVIPLIF